MSSGISPPDPDPSGANLVEISTIASTMEFRPVRKKPSPYTFVPDAAPGGMPPMTYTQSKTEQKVVTMTGDGWETENTAFPGDIIFSGPRGENYVLTPRKFAENYAGALGSTVIPEQNPRLVAEYRGSMAVSFVAPWGKRMVLKPGDFLVREGEAGHYRIAREEFEETYGPFPPPSHDSRESLGKDSRPRKIPAPHYPHPSKRNAQRLGSSRDFSDSGRSEG